MFIWLWYFYLKWQRDAGS